MNNSSTVPAPPNPNGLCMCGCGQVTGLAKCTDKRHGLIKGQHLRHIPGHHCRKTSPEYVVDPDTGCWIWQRAKAARGYGWVSYGGKRGYAHRLYYEIAYGPIPDGLELDHLCRNHACVNPTHLEAVTHAENMRRGKNTKLTQAKVAAIRRKHLAGRSLQALALEYGVNSPHICNIVRGHRWKDAVRP